MGQEEAKYQQNDTDELGICLIDIISCYWKCNSGKLMLRITGLNGIGEYVFEAKDVKVYYTDTLDLKLIGNSIGVKKSRESRNFWAAKEWREWAVRFTNAKRKRLARLVRILGRNSLEEVFVYQVNIDMLRTLRYHLLRRARLNKPGGNYRRAPNNSGMKYGIRVPRKTKEAAQLDTENGNLLWTNAILKDLEALMSMKVFMELLSSLYKAGAKGFQFAPLRIIFDVKVDLRRKER